MDAIKKLQIKKKAAEMLVDIYDLAIKREDEQDPDKKKSVTEKIIDMQKKRNDMLKRVKS